jgi:hypothetical protein
MTQEELDALMAGGIEDDEVAQKEVQKEVQKELPEDSTKETKDAREYRASADMSWPPPPPTDDHKMVHQLDDVTRDSEIKAGEVFDKLEAINEFMVTVGENGSEVTTLIDSNIALFSTLCKKFPNVEDFSKALENNKEMKSKVEGLIQASQDTEDEVMMTMDIMQYQDIHRQKIERVINVMRALSGYMSSLFEGKIDDSKRVGSAVHIEGDESTESVVTNDDIEALIANLGKN